MQSTISCQLLMPCSRWEVARHVEHLRESGETWHQQIPIAAILGGLTTRCRSHPPKTRTVTRIVAPTSLISVAVVADSLGRGAQGEGMPWGGDSSPSPPLSGAVVGCFPPPAVVWCGVVWLWVASPLPVVWFGCGLWWFPPFPPLGVGVWIGWFPPACLDLLGVFGKPMLMMILMMMMMTIVNLVARSCP